VTVSSDRPRPPKRSRRCSTRPVTTTSKRRWRRPRPVAERGR
jgi:hypothetical protein